MNNTLQHVLGRFNLDVQADYSKVSMPLALKMNRRELAELFCELGFRVGAEIGTAGGLFAETLCKANPEGKLYCCDPWQAYSQYKDYTHQGTLDTLYDQARERLAPYRVGFLRRFLVEAAECFGDGSLDWVYIDANHEQTHVAADLEAWFPKVRRFGCLSGHDFSHPRGKNFGVVEAVTECCERNRITPWFIMKGAYEAVGDRSHSWLMVKE